MIAALERPIRTLALVMALLGGVALLGLVAMTVLSVTGRNLTSIGLSNINGDFELVEAGTAFAVFAFLPWCQFNRGHAAVEILAPRFGPTLNNIIDVIAEALMLAMWVFLIWRLWLGMADKRSYAETTFILQYPIWWAYAASLAAGIAVVIVATFCLFRAIDGLVTGKRASKVAGHE